MALGFIGLGKLGLPYAEWLAERHEVVGHDVEPRSSSAIRIVAQVSEVLRDCRTILVCVPTPHSTSYDGSRPASHLNARDFDYGPLIAVLSDIQRLATRAHTVIVVSTVLPGTCRSQLAEHLLNHKLLYMPAFAAMGTIREDLERPDISVLGCQDPKQFHDDVLPFPLPDACTVTTWEEAESVKVLYNTFISLKITFTNVLLDLSAGVGNIDADVVARTLSQSQRLLSKRYLTPGMGDGGPCHPRDNLAMRFLAERLQFGYDLFGALMHAREKQARNMARFLKQFGGRVYVVGSAYKPEVSLTDGSASLLVAHYLRELGIYAGVVDADDFDPGQHSGVFLLAHDTDQVRCLPYPVGSTLVDPWRKAAPREGLQVVHYGNSRGSPGRHLDSSCFKSATATPSSGCDSLPPVR